MAVRPSGDVELLRGRMSGPVLTSGDGAAYDAARSVWNGAIDHHPAVIARCADAADVAAAIAFARSTGLELSVRGGAHNFGGAAVGDDGLTIDLSGMAQVQVDPARRVVRCGGGTTLAGLDAATQAHGLACAGGTVSHTGVGGLTLGGGFGWLTPTYGLACDNMTGAELVTADGDILTVSASEHPDLLWGLRGGGGNFGVVTRFEFQAHPVGPTIQLGLLFYDLDHGPDALALAQQVVSSLPACTGVLIAGLNAPPAPFVPEEHHFAAGYAILLAGFGTAAAHARLCDDVRAGLAPLFEFRSPMPFVALQQLLDDAAPWGILAYEKALYLPGLTPEVISVVCEHMPGKRSPMSIVPIFPMTGAYCATDEEATAFGGSRSPGLVFNIGAVAPSPGLLETDTAWVGDFYRALLPHATNPGGYVNFMHDYEFDRVRAAYGATKYQRLAQLKRTFDPDNIFHRNPNIHPTPAGPKTPAETDIGASS